MTREHETRPSWGDLQRDGARLLQVAGVDGAMRDARLLLADAMGVDLTGLIAVEMSASDAAIAERFKLLLQRRAAGEPVSRIRGWREFYGRRFAITGDVLDPRPETELLVEEGLKRLPTEGRVLDLGTGSGCILISLLAERVGATGWGVDISPAALGIATINAQAIGVASRATFATGSWGDPKAEAFDLIVSNPPYVTEAEYGDLAVEVRVHDPRLALVGGADGLDPYRAIVAGVAGRLRPGGWLGLEFGATQAEAVSALMVTAGLEAVEVLADLAGLPRAAFGRREREAS